MKYLVDVFCARSFRHLTFFSAVFLSACGTQPLSSGLPSLQPAPTQTAQPAGPVQGETIGNGNTRVALLLPLTAEGNGGRIAAEMKNAAQLAMDDAGAGVLQVVVKDTAGTEAGASASAASAMSEGAAIVLGPVFAPNVQATASVLASSRRPMIAFSSDRAAAGPNTYLNSFLPEGLVRRIISYAGSQGLMKVVAIVPNGPAGNLAETEARSVLQEMGGSLVALARYDYDNASVQAAVQEVAMAIAEADAIFMPDGGNSPSAIVSALQALGVDLSGKRLLGTGQWASVDLTDQALGGAWFADVGHARLSLYRSRYQQRFGTEPSITSALAYDTVILAATLARNGDAAVFTPANLQTPAGFSGYTGTFRFRPDGTSERGYAVYEVRNGQAELISPAPTSLMGGS